MFSMLRARVPPGGGSVCAVKMGVRQHMQIPRNFRSRWVDQPPKPSRTILPTLPSGHVAGTVENGRGSIEMDNPTV